MCEQNNIAKFEKKTANKHYLIEINAQQNKIP
jgi:hypothetical protein